MSDRHAFRATWHDYNGGLYFITVCSFDKIHVFGEIKDYNFYPTEIGKIVAEHIRLIPSHHADTELLNYVVIPNHIHLVIAINPRIENTEKVQVGTRIFASAEEGKGAEEGKMYSNTEPPNIGCLKFSAHGEVTSDFHHNSRLATVIGTFKAGVTRTGRERKFASTPKIWQARYHEHIIRDQRSYDNIMAYIDNNVANWTNDCFC